VSPPAGNEFSSIVSAWLTWLEHNRGASQSTIRCYEMHLTRMLKWFATPPADPSQAPDTRDPMAATITDLQKYTGIYAHALGISPRARRPMVAAVRGVYRWAHSRKHLRTNPAEQLPYPHAGKRLPRSPSLADAERLLMQPNVETFTGLRDATMIAILMGCGLRISGLVALNESALLWTSNDAGEHLTLRVMEKGKKERLIPAPREVALLLRAYLGHPDLTAIDRTSSTAEQIVFVSTRNRRIGAHDYHGDRRRLSQRTVRQMLEGMARRAGIAEGSRNPHGLRHLFGTELAESDVSLEVIQTLLGHADIKDTRIYIEVAMRRMRETIDKAGPLAKMKSPLLSTLRSLDRAVTPGRVRVSVRPPDADNQHSRGLDKGKT